MIPPDIDEIIAGIIHQEESGEDVDRESLLQAHSEHADTLRGTYEELSAAFQQLVDTYVTTRYPRKSSAAAARPAGIDTP